MGRERDCELQLRPHGQPPPQVAELNVSNSRMHIGPEFVSVTRGTHRGSRVAGPRARGSDHRRVSGPALPAGADGGARRLRCSVAVFACWALAVAAALAFYGAHLALAGLPARLDLDISEPWYLRRSDWQALPPYSEMYLTLPLRYALVGHSGADRCEERYNCTALVMSLQQDHLRRGWDDIAPNFLLTGGGLAFEGRGANVQGVMVPGWNSRAVSLMFVGDYRRGRDAPAALQLRRAAALLAALVRAGALHPRYVLLAHCQVQDTRASPGENIVRQLGSFEHWANDKVSKCITELTPEAPAPSTVAPRAASSSVRDRCRPRPASTRSIGT